VSGAWFVHATMTDAADRHGLQSAVAGDVPRTRVMARIADYLYAEPSGLPWVLLMEPDHEAGAEAAAAAVRAAPGAELTGVFRQISPVSGWLTADGVVTVGLPPTGDALLSVVMDVDADALEVFHSWYDEEHLPRLSVVPGILAARRFAARDLAPGGRHRFLAHYEMKDRIVVESAEFAAASVMSPRTEEVVPHLTWGSQLYTA
jgi:hypothetical protein